MHSALEQLAADLDGLRVEGLLRARFTVDGPQQPRITVDGAQYLAFCSNDYLGLASHPDLVEAVRDGAARYGVGAGASHLVTGHHQAHQALESELAQYVGLPRALLFSTGYMANLGVISALLSRHDAVFADRLNHASLVDAALLSRAELHRYGHLDMDALERQLAASKAKRKLVATDAVFSMDGDMAPVRELVDLCRRHDAWLLLDDAHGFGVLGPGGRGILAHAGVSSPRVIYLGTLGKAAGVFGAFVAGEPLLIEVLLQRARPYIYTTALPPLIAHALRTSLKLIAQADARRLHLDRLAAKLKSALEPGPWRLLPSQTPIQPLLVGGNDAALALSRELKARGILVPAIRPPTVPRGTARLRICLSAAHSEDDVNRLGASLLELAQLLEPRG